MKKLSNTEGKFKKSVAYKKIVNTRTHSSFSCMKCKQTKIQGNQDCLWTHIFTLLCDYYQFFLSFLSRCKISRIKRLLFVKETNLHITKDRAESQIAQIIRFLFNIQLPVEQLREKHPNTIELASWLVHVLRDFKTIIKKLHYPLNTS